MVADVDMAARSRGSNRCNLQHSHRHRRRTDDGNGLQGIYSKPGLQGGFYFCLTV